MLCLLFAGCKEQTKHSTEFYGIDFEQSFETKRQMLLSEIVDTVEYLELKTPEDIIISTSGEYIFVYLSDF
jgi:hypothetical protein